MREMTFSRTARYCSKAAPASDWAISPRSLRLPGKGISWETIRPALLVAAEPMPATGQGPPLAV